MAEDEIGPAAVVIDGCQLTLRDIASVARGGAPAILTTNATVRSRIETSRRHLRELVEARTPVYGVTTGFGDSVHRHIDSNNAALHQERLIAFLGNGTGATLQVPTARAVMLIRANNLARGYSGVRIELIERLLELLNAGITPVIPEEGSVGASGDLVPLSYVAAAVMGRRKVHFRGRIVDAADALAETGLAPLVLQEKEGLGLVNGTAVMAGIAGLACLDAERLARIADVCTAMTVEVLGAITTPFHPFLHDVTKPHPGQIRSAANIRGLLTGSRMGRQYEDVIAEITSNSKPRHTSAQIQDKYSIRCAPHFTGVLWDVLAWATQWLETEINASTDNPLLDPASGEVFSGGNFSGGHVALAMDTLKAAVSSVADLLDRQLALVVDEKFNRGLGPNLIPACPEDHPEYGVNHGFKGMQLACSSLTADALSRGMPLSAFSRSTECHNQDKVSMGTTAARQARDVIEIVERVAAIHLLALCQAADLRGAHQLGRTAAIHAKIRATVPFVDRDRAMDQDIIAVVDMIRNDTLLGPVGQGTDPAEAWR
jgi:histidine ammonia-lyase/phenylalanine ammonia-lyase